MTSFYGAAHRTEATLEVRQLLEGRAPGEGALLEALHRVQHSYGYVPQAAIPAVAQHLRLPESRVYGAGTLYPQVRPTPPPETLIPWCRRPTSREPPRHPPRPAPRPVQRHLRQRAPGVGGRPRRRAADRRGDRRAREGAEGRRWPRPAGEAGGGEHAG